MLTVSTVVGTGLPVTAVRVSLALFRSDGVLDSEDDADVGDISFCSH